MAHITRLSVFFFHLQCPVLILTTPLTLCASAHQPLANVSTMSLLSRCIQRFSFVTCLSFSIIATSPEGLKILIKDQPNRPSNTTKNIVYRDFLENIVGDQVLFITKPTAVLFPVMMLIFSDRTRTRILSNLLLPFTLYVA